MGKKWRKPVMELITRDELEDLIVAAGCSTFECVAAFWR